MSTTTTTTTVKVTICGPNLPGDASGTFHVHKAGCADLTRSPMYRRIDPPWSMDATSEREVVEAVYSDIIDENPDYGWESYHHDFKFFPCIGGLPVEVAEEPKSARDALVDMLADKVRQAQAAGATEDEAIAAVRALWREHLESRS